MLQSMDTPSKKHHLAYWYEIAMCILSLAAVILSFTHFMGAGNKETHGMGWVIYCIFLLDFVYALIRRPSSMGRRGYILQHRWEFFALIPVELLFNDPSTQYLLRVLRAIAYLMRFTNRARKFFDTCGFKYAILLFLMLITTGAWSFHKIENQSLFDSCWWAVVTVATVGYGDIVPHTVLGKLIGMGLMAIGVGFIGLVASTITTYITTANREEREKLKERHQNDRAILRSIHEQIDHLDELSEQDIKDIACTLESLRKAKK